MDDLQNPTFSVKGLEAWRRYLDQPGHCSADWGAINFAATWATRMEEKMATGATLADIAQLTVDEANTGGWGITIAMFTMAIQILRQHWTHSESLTAWAVSAGYDRQSA